MAIFLRKQQGQGLVETTITFLIIAGVVLALSRFQLGLAYGNSVSQQQNTAMLIAMKEIETLRDYTAMSGYNSIASTTVSQGAENTTYSIAAVVSSFSNPTYKKL